MRKKPNFRRAQSKGRDSADLLIKLEWTSVNDTVCMWHLLSYM